MKRTPAVQSIPIHIIDRATPADRGYKYISEAEASLPCLQQPAIGLYPEPCEFIHNFPPSSSKIRCNFILPCLPNGLLASAFLLNFVRFSVLSHICYMSRPSHSPWLYHPDNICWGVQVMNLLIMQCFPVIRRLTPLVNVSCSVLFLGKWKGNENITIRVFHFFCKNSVTMCLVWHMPF